MPYRWTLVLVVFCVIGPHPGWSAPQASQEPKSEPTPQQPTAQQLVQEMVEGALWRANGAHLHWSFREVVRKDGRSETHEICQTDGGDVDRLVALENQPLSSEQRRREDQRIQKILADPSEIRKEKQRQREDSEKERRMFEIFPRAFRYEYAGNDGDLVQLKFEPDPQFEPANRQEEVFHHMEGTMWIHPEQKQLARIDGRLTSQVKFLGGVLGYLEKGGTFSVTLRDVGSGHWEMADLDVKMDGKALLFKTFAVREQKEYGDYWQVPDSLTLRQAAELLEKRASAFEQTAVNTSK
jgi:hypothetical protein